MNEYEDQYQITTQINPGILSHKLNKDHMDLLWSYIKDSTKRGGWVLDENNKVIERDNFQEWSLEDTSNRFCSEVLDPAINKYIEYWGYPTACLGTHFPIPKFSRFWVRLSGRGEYQALHEHQSIWTFIVWMNIPFEPEDEHSEKENDAHPEGANVTIIYTDAVGRIRKHPYELGKKDEGTILIFPSSLNHIVYPHHTTDEYRISIAGDICVDSLNCLDPVMMEKKNDHLYPKTL